MAKEQKTKEELEELLNEAIRPYQLGSEPNCQWKKIVAVENQDGSNWTVSHNPEGNPPGDFWKAIEHVLPELQGKYDLLAD